MTGVRSVFSEKELEFMKNALGVEFSDTKDYTKDELSDLYWYLSQELPYEFDEDGYPLESGRIFLSIMDKFFDYL